MKKQLPEKLMIRKIKNSARAGKLTDCFNMLNDFEGNREWVVLLVAQILLRRHHHNVAFEFAAKTEIAAHKIPIIYYKLGHVDENELEKVLSDDPRLIDARPVATRGFYYFDTPFIKAVREFKRRSIEFCMNNGADACLQNDTNGYTPLIQALTKTGNVDFIRQIVDYNLGALYVPDTNNYFPINHLYKKRFYRNSNGRELITTLISQGALQPILERQKNGNSYVDPFSFSFFSVDDYNKSHYITAMSSLIATGLTPTQTTLNLAYKETANAEPLHWQHMPQYRHRLLQISLLETAMNLAESEKIFIDMDPIHKFLDDLKVRYPEADLTPLVNYANACDAEMNTDESGYENDFKIQKITHCRFVCA